MPANGPNNSVPLRITIGVMGSAGGTLTEEVLARVRRLGEEIARRGCVLITGACPGIPHEAVLGSKAKGGLTIGISPALSPQEHRDLYKSPLDHYDALIYTGSGLMGREVTNIRSCDLIVIAGGRSGTLGEFAIAYDEGRVIGVLQGTGGIADRMHEIVGAYLFAGIHHLLPDLASRRDHDDQDARAAERDKLDPLQERVRGATQGKCQMPRGPRDEVRGAGQHVVHQGPAFRLLAQPVFHVG